ncbi:MAG: amidohydrolase family protein [Pseudothermotoga sp.]
MIAIAGGTVWTGFEVIEDGLILVKDGKISYAGKRKRFDSRYKVIDAKGKFVCPGFVDAHSHIGLIPEGLDWEYSDVNDFSGPITPQMRAIDAIDFFDKAFSDAISGGVTTVYTGPGSANVIGGVGLITKTTGRVLVEQAALKMALGPKGIREYKSKESYPTTRMGTVALLRNTFLEVKKWMEDPKELDESKKIQYELISKVLKREMMAKIHLSTSPDEINAVLDIIKEFNLDATIDHVFAGDLLAERIKESGVPVVYGPAMISKLYSAFRYVSDTIPVKLCHAGVLVALMTDHPVIPQKHLRLLGSVVVRNGLSYDETLKMITINPAKMLKIDDKVGSISPNKDADILIFSDHPLKVSSRLLIAIVDGEVVFQQP